MLACPNFNLYIGTYSIISQEVLDGLLYLVLSPEDEAS